MAEVFISYRRESCGDLACLLRDRLQNCGYEVFMDVYCLGRGDYMDALQEKIRECAHFIVLLAPGDLERCKDEEDVFRQEIEFAFEYKKNIVPLFKRGFIFPETLPKSINKLPRENGMEVSIEWLDPQIQKLTEKFLVPQTEPHQGQLTQTYTPPPQLMQNNPHPVDIPTNRYTERTLAAMGDIARSDVENDSALYSIIEKAKDGDPDAQTILGKKYFHREVISKKHENEAMTIFWLTKAIEKKHPEAMYYLGKCYGQGHGVPANKAMAAYWYEESASHASPCKEAILAIAECYISKNGVSDDVVKKAKWCLKAMAFEDIENAKSFTEVQNTYRYIHLFQKSTHPDQEKLKNAGYSVDELDEKTIAYVEWLYHQKIRKDRAEKCLAIGALSFMLMMVYAFFLGVFNQDALVFPHSMILLFLMVVAVSLIAHAISVKFAIRNKKKAAACFVCIYIMLVLAALITIDGMVWAGYVSSSVVLSIIKYGLIVLAAYLVLCIGLFIKDII